MLVYKSVPTFPHVHTHPHRLMSFVAPCILTAQDVSATLRVLTIGQWCAGLQTTALKEETLAAVGNETRMARDIRPS